MCKESLCAKDLLQSITHLLFCLVWCVVCAYVLQWYFLYDSHDARVYQLHDSDQLCARGRN
jgi:hypothetical protein